MSSNAAIVRSLRAIARDVGLVANDLEIRPVLNWGGFANLSFHVSDGRQRFHLKLTPEPDKQAKLRRWLRVADGLTARFHAPPAVARGRRCRGGMRRRSLPTRRGEQRARVVAGNALRGRGVALRPSLRHEPA